MRTVPDAREIREWIERGTSFLAGIGKYSGFQIARPPTRAVVVGGGFIGLEMADNLAHRGFDVTVVELADQVLAPLDREYARIVEDFLELHGVHVALDDGVAGFAQSGDETLDVSTQSGKTYPADLVILALGVRPDTALAGMAGIEVGEHGGIRVDAQMRTSDPDIFAVGDAVEVKDFVTGEWSLIALAGPANRQARIAADAIAGRDSRFRGTQGTSVVELFGSAVAWTGVNEKTLERLGDTDYEKVYLYPNSHAGYYPGAKPIAMKLLFRRSDGRVLGAQAVGEDGVDKRISELALAIQLGATVYDLEESELCYSPPFGSAKDPINFAGMVAAGVLRGDMPLSHWDSTQDGFLLDVREQMELALEAVPEAVNIPLGEVRSRLDELPGPRDSRHLPLRPTRLLRDALLVRTGSTPGWFRAGCCRTRSSRTRARTHRGRPQLTGRSTKQARTGSRWSARPSRRSSAGRPVGLAARRAAAGRRPRRTCLPQPGRDDDGLVPVLDVSGARHRWCDHALSQGGDGWLVAPAAWFLHLPAGRLPAHARPGRPRRNPDERRRLRPAGAALGRDDG